MDYFVLKDYKKEEPKKLNKKKVVKMTLIMFGFAIVVLLASMYIGNSEFRGWTDKYILGKEITENTGAIINIDSESNPYIYAYDRFIVVLNRNHLQSYGGGGSKESDIELTITNPLFASNGRYLCVAEKGGNKIYLISGEHILWQKDLEGEISQISVNRNGYVSVSHKSMVKLYNNDGKELATAHLSSTYPIDTAVSNDNSELAIAEINYSGNLLQSNIKIISVDKTVSDPDNAVIYTYKSEKKNIITKIYYQDGNTLMCMLDNGIVKRVGDESSEETKFDTNTLFADINLNGHTVEVKKIQSGLFSAEAQIEIKPVGRANPNVYMTNFIPKDINVYDSMIAINAGTEVDFINTNGWLIKKYTSTRNIKDVVMCGSVAGIVYKDKIEIVNF
ncbi:MAG: hypothetical protein IKP28_06400 [Clostridia bacterium]|nr:hypothetical protein [Clostridia bacterium]